ncbi:MAG: DUF1365 domain-containing protein [Acidobacteria bacterium]|nr:DUF1365 domain-containing protein [Acidobacteriota bacterium]
MNTASGLYEGFVRHHRRLPRPHAFRYRIILPYLDLAEIPDVLQRSPFWGYEKPRPATFRRRDYLGDARVPLDTAVRALVLERLGREVSGPIRMLGHPRYFGYCFNPVTFYYCFDEAGEALDAIVAEITNTPWGERYSYVLDAARSPRRRFARFQLGKRFHVSPFLDMDFDYDWRFSRPGERLVVHMKNLKQGVPWFDATLALERKPITGVGLSRTLIRFPLMTATVIGAIHFEALRLWLKRTPFFPHPHRAGAVEP